MPPTHYLQRPQIATIFAAFVLLTLPLAWLQLSPTPPSELTKWVIVGYAALVGNTHFAITGALYLNSENLRYFASTPGRRVIYFATPLSILAVFCVIGMLQLPRAGTQLFVPFTVAVTMADYYHVVRQSFGVFEMFKTRTGVAFPRWLVGVANWYFLALLVLQITTFITGIPRGFNGMFDPSHPVAQVAGAVAAALFATLAWALITAWRTPGADRAAVAAAGGYLLLQSASALITVYRSRLYLASLAMHYVEYHVLMAPRLFTPTLDASDPADRVAAAIRRHKAFFYLLLAGVGVFVSLGGVLALLGTNVTRDSSRLGWLLVNLTNGIFLTHYFIEAFVWKFSNPYYRRTLAPVYFPPPASETSQRKGQKRRHTAAT